jgi:hypothetical protein
MASQETIIRENVKRRYWRRVVNLIVRNLEHYDETGDTMSEFDYWSELNELVESAWIGEIDLELLRNLDFYHPYPRY